MHFYATPGPMTEITADSRLLAGLPTDAESLCRVSAGLIVHEFTAPEYAAGRLEELETRRVDDIISLIDRLDPRRRPLAESREPAHRMIGNCRQFTVLTCALLRRAGVPARARAGFADYFGDGWVDHWVAERWDGDRWRRTDAQLDEEFCTALGIGFDPLDLPEGRYLSGAEAWLRCRGGDDDPARFGIQDMRGMWFIAGNVVRDLAALRKVELLPWDVWGAMPPVGAELDDDGLALFDAVASAVAGGTDEDRRRCYEREALRVPDVVRSHRFQRDVHVVTRL